MERRPFDLTGERNDEIGGCQWRVRVHEELPAHLSLIVGDALHNLRAALDLLVVDVARMRHGIDEADLKRVYFPVAADREKFATDREIRKTLALLHPAATKLIQAIEPYHQGEGELILKLHRLDILDKHRLLVPTVAAIRPQQFGFGMALPTHGDASVGADMKIHERDAQGLRDGDVVASLSNIEGGEVRLNMRATFTIAFGEGPAQAESVHPLLYQMGQTVQGIIQEFDAAFPI